MSCRERPVSFLCLLTLALAVTPNPACDFASIENSQDQYPHRVAEGDGSGFTAGGWSTAIGSGMALERHDTANGIRWNRRYNSESFNYHFSANRVPAGPIRIWHVGQTGTTQSVFRILTVDAVTGDSLGTDTLYTDAAQYLRGTFIATREGGMISCINSWGGSRGAKPTLFALRTDARGKTAWTADLLAEAKAHSDAASFMFSGGLETEDGHFLIAIAATSIKLGGETSDAMLLFRIDAVGSAAWLGTTSEIPCDMARNTKRVHYTGFALQPLSVSYFPKPGEAPTTATIKLWSDREGVTGVHATLPWNSLSHRGPISLRAGGAMVFAHASGSVATRWFRADGCRTDP